MTIKLQGKEGGCVYTLDDNFLALTLMSIPEKATSSSKTLLPGFGLRLNHVPQEDYHPSLNYTYKMFPNALSADNIEFGSVSQVLLTLRELTMLHVMNTITDKAEWNLKINDETIAQKWRNEILGSGADITDKMLDWCIDELRYKATLIPPAPSLPPPVIVYNGDVVKSDFALSQDFKTELQKAVSIYEGKILLRLKDWHPGSDEKVWDLVHPSLFPLVYGRTRILANGETTTIDDCIRRCCEGEVVPVPPSEETTETYQTDHWTRASAKHPYSAKFQWLPCEVDISADEARITSYINNLHPREEKPLYDLISKLITASIPLWELSLAPLRNNSFWRQQRIKYTEVLYDPDPEYDLLEDAPQQESDEDEDDFLAREQDWIESTKEVVLPEPEGEFVPLSQPPVFSLKETFGERGLQVIVKLANIQLTPEKPEYNGGSWHVEGQMNEHIVATSLYYYSSSNITSSTLSFRQQCSRDDAHEVNYRQNQLEWLTEVFGCEDDGPCIQEIGHVETCEGRLLTFPNILQHRVGPFKLEDPYKPGHRKIVALFLVDPNIKIISTAHVPCQRQDWWWSDVMRSLGKQEPHPSVISAGIASLPQELRDQVQDELDNAEFPMSLAEAKRLRLELMDERKDFVVRHGKNFESQRFSLCEH